MSGTFRDTLNEDRYSMGFRYPCIIWGTSVLEDELGGWDCTHSGTDGLWSENGARDLGVCPGAGECDGLAYVLQQVSGGVQDFGDGTDIPWLVIAATTTHNSLFR